MTDTLHGDAATTAVLRVFRSSPAIRQGNTRIHLARYSFTQLQAWLASILEPGVPQGVRTSDIDERGNAVRIGVADAAITGILRARAQQAGVPDSALVIAVIPPIVPATASLTSWIRPVMGGLYIVTTRSGCSLGFKAKVGASRFVLTNAHCTSTFGVDDNDQLGQPNLLSPSYFIGTEYSDPAFVSGGSCPSGASCRYSDAAMFQCDTLSHCSNYTIARTTFEYTGSNWNESGSSELTTEPWYVTAELTSSDLTQGTSVSKVGATSGWTGGTVSQTCISSYHVGGQNKHLLCQYSASFVSRNGDSGSPVFKYNSSDGTASLGGIVRAIGGGVSYFSPIWGVKTDLGSMTVSAPVF